jgi:hypothetical protein
VTELTVNRLNEKAKALNKKLTLCRSVKRLLNQKGWRTIIQPTIDKMITDITGSKKGNTYSKGILSSPDYEKSDYYIGYKQALMDLNNRIWNYPESIDLLKKQIKNLEEQAKSPTKYTIPMKGGKYGR